jgi:predicted RNase H-like HicB family nuclease
MSYKVTIVIEQDEDGYYAFAPELDGCQSQGDSLDEVLANIKEAVELYMETLTIAELKQALSKAVLTTTLEVAIA